jgi:hypothetical protein
LLKALADTGASCSIILEAYASAPFIKTYYSNTTTWSTMAGKFTTTKTWFVTFSLPEFNLKIQMCSSWSFHVDDCSESSSTYDMKTCENLHIEEQHQLKLLLQKYEHQFDGTLGEFIMEPISLQLMDPNCKPIHASAYTVPRSVEQQLRQSKEIVRLVNIGVLE